MQIIYLLLLSVLLATYFIVLRRVLRRSSELTPTLGWIIGLGFFVVAPLSIMTVSGGFALPAVYGVDRPWGSVDLSNPGFFLPYLVIWLALMLSCLVIYLFSVKEGREVDAATPGTADIIKRTLWITFFAAICYWVFTVELAGGMEQFLISHWYTRGEDLAGTYGDAYVLLTHLALCNQVIFTTAAALYTGMALGARRLSWRIMSAIIFELLGETLISGNRIHIAIYLLAVFTLCWLHKRTRILLTMCALAPVLVVVFSLWASVRGNLSELGDRTGGYFDSDRGNSVVTSLMDVTEGSDTMLLMHIVRDFGNNIPYLYGRSYIRAITSLIPRRLYPSKSENFTTVLAEIYLPGEVTSLNATAIGEMYANFGPGSLLLLPLLTFGIIWLSHWAIRTQPRHPLRPGLLFVLAIVSARVTLEDSAVIFILAMIFMRLARLEHPTRQLAVVSERRR
jgi:hypothetical protein